MREADVILATGGPGLVKAAYSSGKPAIVSERAILLQLLMIRPTLSCSELNNTFKNFRQRYDLCFRAIGHCSGRVYKEVKKNLKKEMLFLK